jgi:hypothetical protein
VKLLKITSCADPHIWYADSIGFTYHVRYTIQLEKIHMVIDDEGYNNIVHFRDCIILN